ncbi:NAD(P)-dependent oxidoreductase [Diaminobutyricibacter sp. McL0608]|uniref:NAD(P)-dependent oxidoreductase n=1 Tax=Leifsonia sp. McL0608 TaxID=3143537 RepID=UPI0031F33203
MLNIVVFGANGGTGRLLVRQALDAGHTVTAVTRHQDAFPIAHENLTVLAADVYDPNAVDSAVAGHDVVLSALGVPYGRKPISVYSTGVANIITAMDRHGIRRLVCVSSSATDPATRYHDTGGGFFFEKVLKPIITKTMGKELYADMLRMEQLVQQSDLEFTIVRPSGLFETPGVTEYVDAAIELPERFTSRADLAAFMMRLGEGTEYSRTSAAVATVSTHPRVIDLIRQEALGRS